MQPLSLDGIIHRLDSRARSYKLRLDQAGQVILVTPKRYRAESVKRFVIENQAWIQQQVNAWKTKKEAIETETHIRLFGTAYRKEKQIDPTQPSAITISNQTMYITLNNQKPSTLQKTINNFLKNTAEHYLIPRTKQLAKKMTVDYRAISIGEDKSQWGRCTSDQRLRFNWRLIHMPRQIIDYVIIHELAHLTHHNHSSRFWHLVAQFDQHYKHHRKWLKKYGLSVG